LLDRISYLWLVEQEQQTLVPSRDGTLHERLQALERDKELLLESYTTRAPEALNSLGPEERRTVYSMLGLRVDALPDKSLRVRGALGEETLVCHPDRTSTR